MLGQELNLVWKCYSSGAVVLKALKNMREKY